MADQNLTSSIDKAILIVGGGGPNNAPGKPIGGYAAGESVRLEPDGDRVTMLKGLRGQTFKVAPLESIGRLVTATLTESSKSLAYMDALYQAGVPFPVIYRNGETNLAGTGMILAPPAEGISQTEITRVFRIGMIGVVGVSGAHATATATGIGD